MHRPALSPSGGCGVPAANPGSGVSLEQFEQCCSVAMLVLATLLLLAATLHHAPAVAE